MKRRKVIPLAAPRLTPCHGLRRVEYSTTDYILKYVCDIVVKEVHVRGYLVCWRVSCPIWRLEYGHTTVKCWENLMLRIVWFLWHINKIPTATFVVGVMDSGGHKEA